MMVVREKEAQREDDWRKFQIDVQKDLHKQSQDVNVKLLIVGLVAIGFAVTTILAGLYPQEIRAFVESPAFPVLVFLFVLLGLEWAAFRK